MRQHTSAYVSIRQAPGRSQRRSATCASKDCGQVALALLLARVEEEEEVVGAQEEWESSTSTST